MDKLFEFLLYQPGPNAYIVAFLILLACGLGIPIPEDITLFVMGWLAYTGLVDFKIAVFVCLAGVLIGDITIFLAGKFWGVKFTKKGFLSKVFNQKRMDGTKSFFVKWGNKVIFAARFMPGLRAPIFFSAGTFKVPFRVFLFYDGLAALLSVPIFVGAFYYFGDVVESVLKTLKAFEHGMIFLILSVVIFFVLKNKILKRKSKKK